MQQTIRRALLSVSDKTGIVELARALVSGGVEVLSTGGTYRLLSEADIAVTEVSAYTGFPEMMDGRVKTLHPKIHGGILGRRNIDSEVMTQHGIDPISGPGGSSNPSLWSTPSRVGHRNGPRRLETSLG